MVSLAGWVRPWTHMYNIFASLNCLHHSFEVSRSTFLSFVRLEMETPANKSAGKDPHTAILWQVHLFLGSKCPVCHLSIAHQIRKLKWQIFWKMESRLEGLSTKSWGPGLWELEKNARKSTRRCARFTCIDYIHYYTVYRLYILWRLQRL